MKYLILIPLLLAASCIIIPTPTHRTEGRVFIKPEMIKFIKMDTTLREDVLLKLGDPDGTALQQQVLIYHWTATRGYAGIGGGYNAAVANINQERFFLICFHRDNKVRKMEIFNYNINKQKKSLEQFVKEWHSTPH